MKPRLFLLVFLICFTFVANAQYELKLGIGANGMSFLDDRPFRVSNSNTLSVNAKGFTFKTLTIRTFIESLHISMEDTKRNVGFSLSSSFFIDDRSVLLLGQQWEINKFIMEDYIYIKLRPFVSHKPYSWFRLEYCLGLSFRTGVAFYSSDVLPRYHYISDEYRSNDLAINPGFSIEGLLPYNFTISLHNGYHYFFYRKDINSPKHTYEANLTLGYSIHFKQTK